MPPKKKTKGEDGAAGLDFLSSKLMQASDKKQQILDESEKVNKKKKKSSSTTSEDGTKKRKKKSSSKKEKTTTDTSNTTTGVNNNAEIFSTIQITEEDDNITTTTNSSNGNKKLSKKEEKEQALGLIFYKLIEYLQENSEKKFTFTELLNILPVNSEQKLITTLDEKTQKNLFKKLKDNPKVDLQITIKLTGNNIDPNAIICFKAIHQSVKKKEDIVNLLKHPEYLISGIPEKELTESYKTIIDDIKDLINNKYLLSIYNEEKKSNILYYNDLQICLEIDNKLKELWKDNKIKNNALKMPQRADDIEEYLTKAKLAKTETIIWPEDEYRRKKEAEREENAKNIKQKRTRKMNINKMTNRHLKDQLQQ
ncbi:hypothetical protein ABK040_010289 [Willaertia magna]